MTNIQQQIKGLCNLPNTIDISFDELLILFSSVKPKYVPILDICTIKTFGDYGYNVCKYIMWKACPTLITEIIGVNTLYSYYNIAEQDIIDIIKTAISKNDTPSSIIDKVYYFVSDSLLKNIDKSNKDEVTNYLSMKYKYNNSLKELTLKYKDTWDDLEKQYENISDALCQNFNELETDDSFEKATELIESIGKEASVIINTLINKTKASILISKNPELTIQIKLDFNKNMDEIYERVISSKHFEKSIHEVILDMYEVNKEMHRMSLTLEQAIDIVKQL
jgi:hypothetical protein